MTAHELNDLICDPSDVYLAAFRKNKGVVSRYFDAIEVALNRVTGIVVNEPTVEERWQALNKVAAMIADDASLADAVRDAVAAESTRFFRTS